ncbi:MAG: LamG domain-containing protein, partial [Bacillati bacterium ANGP1]
PTTPADQFTYSYSGAILADTPNIYYRLGESAGTVATDSSGNAHDATYAASGVTLGVAGAIVNDTNTAITLDGTAGSVQETSGAGVPVGFANRSVEAWFKTTTTTAMPIVAYGSPGIANQYFGVYVHDTAIEVQTGAGTTITFPGTASLSDGAWHHLVVTYDSGAIAGNLKVYIDGGSFGTQTPAALFDTTLDAAGLEVGKDDTVTTAFFNGSLDEVAVYATVLATYQVSNHYKAGTGT